MGEIIFLLLFIAGSGYLFFLTGDLRVSKLDTSGGAAMFPRIVIGLLAVCMIVRILQILLTKEKKEFVWKELFQGNRLFFIVSLVLYGVLLKSLGYILATVFFLVAVGNQFFRAEKGTFGTVKQIIIRNVLLIAFVLFMNYAFGHVLSVKLPGGIFSI